MPAGLCASAGREARRRRATRPAPMSACRFIVSSRVGSVRNVAEFSARAPALSSLPTRPSLHEFLSRLHTCFTPSRHLARVPVMSTPSPREVGHADRAPRPDPSRCPRPRPVRAPVDGFPARPAVFPDGHLRPRGNYRGPMTIVLILGLVFLGMGAFNFAFAVRRRGQLPVWAGFVFAIGLALWLPLLPKPVRIIDGLLIGLGGITLAWSMWRNAAQARSFLSASTVCAG